MKVKHKVIRQIMLSLIFFINLYSCSHRRVQVNYNYYTGEVNFVAKEAEGTITLNSIGYGKNDKLALINAKQNCFSILLFKGIPGSEMKIPLVDNEYESKKMNVNFYNFFFNQGEYEIFIMNISESSRVKIRRGIRIGLQLQINVNSLRKYLEQNQIIRKFGY